MKRFACGDVLPGCRATFVCDCDDDVLIALAHHAAREHDMSTVPDDVAILVREHILSTA